MGLRGGWTERLYENFRFSIEPGRIIAVVGPSGAGKSVLLRRLARRLSRVCWLPLPELARCPHPAIVAIAGPQADECDDMARRMEILSHCGLADAAVLVTPTNRLSGGQLHRLALAAALYRASRRRTAQVVLADEFASNLDQETAGVLCRQMRKLITGSSLAMVAAMPRTDLLSELMPDRIIFKPLGEPARLIGNLTKNRPRRWRIRRGTIGDYDALARFHYVAGRPAAHKRVYVIRPPKPPGSGPGDIQLSPEVAAVLVVSPPLACVRGRNVATGGRYLLGSRRESLALLNREMECISRVIVHPVYRGCGLSVRLVRHALATARTPFMETLAAMAAVHPLFDRAGMKRYGRFEGRGRRYVYYLARTSCEIGATQNNAIHPKVTTVRQTKFVVRSS